MQTFETCVLPFYFIFMYRWALNGDLDEVRTKNQKSSKEFQSAEEVSESRLWSDNLSSMENTWLILKFYKQIRRYLEKMYSVLKYVEICCIKRCCALYHWCVKSLCFLIVIIFLYKKCGYLASIVVCWQNVVICQI